MKVINNIQLGLGRIVLKKKKKRLNRKIKSFGIEKASSIAVLYDATNRNDAELVKKFIQYLKEERKEVSSLGYINTKDSSEIVKPYLNFSFFDNTNLNKSLIPSSEAIEKFISTSYSILIDLTLSDTFPLEYISSLSPSKFKVGAKGNYRDEVCDMTIDIEQDKRMEYLIIQVKHYLKMMNN